MTDAQFHTLQDAVTLAKSGQIHRLSRLKKELANIGHAPEDITAAVTFWSEHLHATYPFGKDQMRRDLQGMDR